MKTINGLGCGDIFGIIRTLTEILKTKEKNEVKILVDPAHNVGIGDCFSNLNVVLFAACGCVGIPVSNITLLLGAYRSDENHFVSDQLKIVYGEGELDRLLDQGFDLHLVGNCYEWLAVDHDFHFSKFITYSDNIIQQASNYSTFISVYLRFYQCETKKVDAEELMKRFMEEFLNQWDASEQYIICSPHPIIKKQNWPSNVELSINLGGYSGSLPLYGQNQRRCKINTESAIRDMAILSYSKDNIAFHGDGTGFYQAAMVLAKNKTTVIQHSTEEILQKIKENQSEFLYQFAFRLIKDKY